MEFLLCVFSYFHGVVPWSGYLIIPSVACQMTCTDSITKALWLTVDGNTLIGKEG